MAVCIDISKLENPAKIKMCNFLRPLKHLRRNSFRCFTYDGVLRAVAGHQLSIIGAQTTNNLSLRRGPPAESVHNNNNNNNDTYNKNEQQQHQQEQQAPLCCQFKMIKQTNINPLQVDACGCRLMALSDSPATLESFRSDPIRSEPNRTDPIPSRDLSLSLGLWDCGNVPRPASPSFPHIQKDTRLATA